MVPLFTAKSWQHAPAACPALVGKVSGVAENSAERTGGAMGLVKSMQLEAEDRGWSVDDDKFVCADCVEDAYLKGVVQANRCHMTCSYCHRTGQEDIAAPLEALMEPIADTLGYFFNEPSSAGVPWDEGAYLVEPKSTEGALREVSLECDDGLFDEICQAFYNDAWVEAADGHWASSHEHEILRDSWNSFVFAVKHETRFHFDRAAVSSSAGPQEFAPRHVLSTIGTLVRNVGLVLDIAEGQPLYRVRVRGREDSWPVDAEQMGAPPLTMARAGRMNPAGIPYLYLALDEPTALAETVSVPPLTVVVAKFKAAKAIKVIDLTRLPPLPSVFDSSKRNEREGLLFLQAFVHSISKPVSKDGSEHIDYVPSQVVSEYFAQVFRTKPRGGAVDGIVYPSAVRPGGKNLVLFPTERGYAKTFVAEYVSASTMSLATWSDLTSALRVR